MTAGRKPKPTALRIVQGNPGKRPLPKNEPKPKAMVPRAPAHLSAEQKKIFRRVAKQLNNANIITRIDGVALELLCEAYSRWLDALDKVKLMGMVVKSPSGFPVQNPYLGIANRAFDQAQKMMTEFGMTPSSRTRVQTVGADEKTESQYDEFV